MKKKINIVLIIAVAGLWGTAGYKYFKKIFFNKEVEVSGIEPGFTDINDFIIKRDTFILEAIEHDPFFDKMIFKEDIAKPIRSYKPVTYSPRKDIAWPAIEYFGYIKSQSNKELILLKIDNKLFRLRIFEQKEGVKVNKIYKDSVQVTFNREKRVIKSNFDLQN